MDHEIDSLGFDKIPCELELHDKQTCKCDPLT